MYDICHPSYYYIEKLGCTDPVKITTAFYVYIELCEAKRFWDVQYKYNEELDLLFLEVKKKKDSNVELYVPWSSNYTITFSEIERIQEKLENERITFVFKSEDSSSVCYTATARLVKPLAPEITKLLKEKDEKRFLLEKEISRNTANLYDLAKSLNNDNHETEASVMDTSESITNDSIGEKT